MEIMALGPKGKEYALIEYSYFVIDGRQRVFSEDEDIMVTRIKIRIYPKQILGIRGMYSNKEGINFFMEVINRPSKEPGWGDPLRQKMSDIDYVSRILQDKIIDTEDPSSYLLVWELGEGVSIYDHIEN